jgi:AAA-like domain
MDSSQVLKLVQERLKPKRLNAAQEIVLVGAWAGKRYQEIANESGYDFDYLKEVGAQLWVILSQALGRSVTKKNLRLVLAEITVGSSNLAPTGKLLEYRRSSAHDAPIALRQFPSEAIPLGSPLYIERPPIEAMVCQEILKPGGFVRIKAPRQMGKTSLVLRVLEMAHHQGLRQAIVDFQTVDHQILQDLNQFLKWVCVNVSRQLGLPPQLEDYWDSDSGSKMSCHVYFQEYLLKSSPAPFLLVLDEVNRIFEYPELAQDFLPLLRSWHDEVARNPVWQGFRLVVVHSTEIYVPLKLNQSPFNVGLPIELPPFTQDQFQILAQRHGLAASLQWATDQIFALIEGHPYLTQLLFYRLQQSDQSLTELLAQATDPTGIYGDHLRRQLGAIAAEPTLQAALKQVITNGPVQINTLPTPISTIDAYHLESLGLVRWVNARAITISCKLYREYFAAYL